VRSLVQRGIITGFAAEVDPKAINNGRNRGQI
jgi:DNA-binding Lrp family transcriptional regulator